MKQYTAQQSILMDVRLYRRWAKWKALWWIWLAVCLLQFTFPKLQHYFNLLSLVWLRYTCVWHVTTHAYVTDQITATYFSFHSCVLLHMDGTTFRCNLVNIHRQTWSNTPAASDKLKADVTVGCGRQDVTFLEQGPRAAHGCTCCVNAVTLESVHI
jgi:hypothetical protein